MRRLYLIKISEIALKKGNKKHFELQLKANIKGALRPHNNKLTIRNGRFYLEVEGLSEDKVIDRLSKIFGIAGFSPCLSSSKKLDALTERAITVAGHNLADGRGSRFKVETRRTDKSLPLDSQGYSTELGGRLIEALPELTVDVQNPDWIVRVELREKGYVYGRDHRGPGGLPIPLGGKGMVLLSGGIDSPVAAYLMAKRGMALDAVYFHTPPYTGEESLEKVKDLARLLAPYCNGLTLFSIPFTEVQIQINRSARPGTITLHSRAAMMRIAQSLGKTQGDGALVTGEALNQVASQTLASLSYTSSAIHLPIFRPLIGMDKEETIRIARKIGTFETSIRPFDDCCTLFSPTHPEVKPNLESTQKEWEGITGMDRFLTEAEEQAEREYFLPWPTD